MAITLRWIELDAEERAELADLLVSASIALSYQADGEEECGEDASYWRRLETQADVLAERVQDAVPLTSADVRAALRCIAHQDASPDRRGRVGRMTAILRGRLVNAQRKVVAGAHKE